MRGRRHLMWRLNGLVDSSSFAGELTFVGETKNSFRPNRVVEREQRDEVGDDAVPHSEYEAWLLRG